MTTELHYVRVKPFNPKKGYKIRVYSYRGTVYHEERGWYVIDEPKLANELRELRADDADFESKLVFDVCTKEQALALEHREKLEAERAKVENARDPKGTRRSVSDHTSMTTRDLKHDEHDELDDSPAARSARAVVDSPEDEEIGDDEELDEGRVRSIGRLSDDEVEPVRQAARKPAKAPASRRAPKQAESTPPPAATKARARR